jgi:hypothetical protein
MFVRRVVTLSPTSALIGMNCDVRDVQPRRKLREVGGDLVERLAVVAHEVHLVDRDDHVLDAQQARERTRGGATASHTLAARRSG